MTNNKIKVTNATPEEAKQLHKLMPHLFEEPPKPALIRDSNQPHEYLSGLQAWCPWRIQEGHARNAVRLYVGDGDARADWLRLDVPGLQALKDQISQVIDELENI